MWNSLFLKDYTLWKGPILEQFMKNCSPWEALTLEKLVEDCVLWYINKNPNSPQRLEKIKQPLCEQGVLPEHKSTYY
ncbi:hypothetical protein BTVI_42780 [Pitangus sulphuratus]|nr:hypothetical protein BTVI_42780 [Pitangus sulphuratus]